MGTPTIWNHRIFGTLLASGTAFVDWWGDSTTTGGGGTFMPLYLGALRAWKPTIWSGVTPMLITDAGGTSYVGAATGQQHQEISSGMSAVADLLPGQTTAALTTDGPHLGNFRKYDFNANRADGAQFRRHRFTQSTWFSGPHWFEAGRTIMARLVLLKDVSGVTELRFRGYREGVLQATTTVDASGAEAMAATTVSCGSTAGYIEMQLQAGTADETSKTVQCGLPFFYADESPRRGLFMHSPSVGAWRIRNWSQTAGENLGSYTARFTAAALASYNTVTDLTIRRVVVVNVGQNDGGTSAADYTTAVENLINRQRTADADTWFILRGPPDPGPALTSRFDDYDTALHSKAMAMDSPSTDSRVMYFSFRGAIREQLGGLGTSAGWSASSLYPGDVVHGSIRGSVAHESLFWAYVTGQVVSGARNLRALSLTS